MRFSMPKAPAIKEQEIIFGDIRISVISERIIRVERGAFDDRATQMVVCRNFCKTVFNQDIQDNKIYIYTNYCEFNVDVTTLKCTILNRNGKYVSFDRKQNLGGTARTLDGSFGNVRSWKHKKKYKDHFAMCNFDCGIFSKNGISILDDSKSILLNEDGTVSARPKGSIDFYVVASFEDYYKTLQEYYTLTGPTPILPKYALSNWWSRYYAYTQDEYISLMDRFSEKGIPFTVATIDMDWHIVNNVPKDVPKDGIQSPGWTGYTFEKELFPDYKKFLKDLKDRKLAVTMNLHPKSGVRYYEEQYPQMANACGIDPDTKKKVEFNLLDDKFRPAYFDILHHPYEEDGVDFWWIDWQQGSKSKMKGLDPLWLLNHYHFMDITRDNKKGIILSRYSGLGSHRYPIGFSGDTLVCWRSLKFQPFFTVTASNVGYTWWSHDIGGHIANKGNEEIYLRWLQFGVFSPINRLHSNNKCLSKEPWNYPGVEETAIKYLRLRQRLLPYLYTANVRTSKEGMPLMRPLYYEDNSPLAYSKKYQNEYFFGSEMLICPITSKADKKGLVQHKMYLPKGQWIDYWTKEVLQGEQEITRTYTLDEYPIFYKKGAIIPMLLDKKDNDMSFEDLEIHIFEGKNSYTIYDEEGFVTIQTEPRKNGLKVDIIPQMCRSIKRLKLIFEDIQNYKVDCSCGYREVDGNVEIVCQPCTIKLEWKSK